MSKNRQNFYASPASPAALSSELAAEYRIIRHDLLRVLAINAIFLAGLLILYYTNLHSHYLDRFAARLLHF